MEIKLVHSKTNQIIGAKEIDWITLNKMHWNNKGNTFYHGNYMTAADDSNAVFAVFTVDGDETIYAIQIG